MHSFFRTFLCLCTLSGTALAYQLPADSKAKADRFAVKDLQTWAMLSQNLFREYEQLQLTAAQVDSLFENHREWAENSFRDHRTFLTQNYEILDDDQDRRLDQILFQKWMNRADLRPAILVFAKGVDVVGLKGDFKELERRLKANQRKSGFKTSDFRRKDFSEKMAKLQNIQWREQIAWLQQHLGETQTEEVIGAPYPIAPKIMLGRRSASGRPANPATGELVKLDLNKTIKRPVDVPADWTLADAKKALQSKRDEIQVDYDDFEILAEELNAAKEKQRERDAREAREAMRRVRPGGMGGGMGGGMMGGMGGMMGGMFSMEIRRQVDNYNVRARFEIEKLTRIIEELGGDPRGEAKEIGRVVSRVFGTRLNWTTRGGSDLLKSHFDATATQCEQFDTLWEEYQKAASRNRTKWEEARASYETGLMRVLDAKQRRKLKQLMFRTLWFSDKAEQAFAVTNVELDADDREKIKVATDKLAALRPPRSVDWKRVHMNFMPKQPSKDWLKLEQEFIDVLSEIVGEKRVPVFLGEPLVHDPNWKRPVVVPTDITLADAEQDYRNRLLEYKLLQERQDELQAEQSELDFADEIDEQRMEELDDEISADFKRIGSLKKKLELAKRVVEELGGKLEP